MSLEKTLEILKGRQSNKKTDQLLSILNTAPPEGQGELDNARAHFLRTTDNQGLRTLDNFLNKIATHQETIETFNEDKAWRSFAISVLLKHNSSLVLSNFLSFSKLESLFKVHIKKEYPLDFINLVFPTELVKKFTVKNVIDLAFDLKKTSSSVPNPILSAVTESKNIALEGVDNPEMFEGLLFFNVFCTAKEAEDLLPLLESLPGHPLFAHQTLYANDQKSQIHPIGVFICDIGPIWSLTQDSIHTSDTVRALSFIKKAISNHPSPEECLISAALYENELNTMNVKISVVFDDDFLGGIDLFSLEYPDIFIEKLDAMLISIGLSPTIRSANVRSIKNAPQPDEYYTPQGWCTVKEVEKN